MEREWKERGEDLVDVSYQEIDGHQEKQDVCNLGEQILYFYDTES